MKTQYLIYLMSLLMLCSFTSMGQGEVDLKGDGVVFPNLAIYPASPDVGQVIYYTTNARFEYWDGSSWQPIDSGGSGASDEIKDGVDNDTYAKAIESLGDDFINFQAEGANLMSVFKNEDGSARLEMYGSGNVNIGDDAGISNTTGIFNTKVGNNAGKENEIGTANTMFGASAGQLNTGNENTFIGTAAGYQNTGSENTMIGRNAGRTNTGTGNIFLGSNAGRNFAGSNQLVIDNELNANPLIYGDIENDRLFINRATPVTSAEYFGISADVAPGNYGGMYVDTRGTSTTKPFMGFSINGTAQSFIYHDGASDEMRFANGVEGLSISNTGVVQIRNSYTLPISGGSANQVLTSNGSGGTSWSTAPASNLVRDGDGDTYVQAIESGTADYIQAKVEGSSGSLQIRKNSAGDLRLELLNTTDNMCVGNNAGDAMITGATDNTFVGNASGSQLTTGDFNSCLGLLSGYSATTGSYNTCLGTRSGYSNNGVHNTIVGYRAANSGSSNHNTVIGSEAFENMDNNSTENVVIGRQAGESADLASYSVLVGYQAGQLVNDGNNVMIGYQAGQNQNNTNQVMKDNVCIGFQAGQENDGNRNVYIGKQAGVNNQGDGNIFIGNNAGGLLTGVSNQLRIANQNTNITNPLILGEFDNKMVGINTTNAIATLHANADSGDDPFRIQIAGSTQFMIHDNGRISVGTSATPTYRFQLPNSGAIGTGVARAFGWVTYSDGRVKRQLSSIENGLDKIMKLEPVSYLHHTSDFVEDDLVIDEESYEKTIGFVAQDVVNVVPEAVIIPEDENSSLWSVNYEKIIPVLTKAIQEQQAMIQDLTQQLAEHQRMLVDISNSNDNNSTAKSSSHDVIK